MIQRWNGIPVDPEQDGWHWIGYPGWIEPKYWCAGGYWRGTMPGEDPEWLTEHAEYLGPCVPPWRLSGSR
jgi:hypothetical protein